MLIEQKTIELLPAGEYPATVMSAESEEGLYGPQVKFTFAVQEPEQYAGKELTGWCSQKFNCKSKLYRWTRAMFGADIPKGWNLETDDLIGKRVSLTLVIEAGKEDSEYNKVHDLRAYRGNGNTPAPRTPRGEAPHFPPQDVGSLTPPADIDDDFPF